MRKCVIFGGAKIADYGRIEKALQDGWYVICCDSGLRHAEHLGIRPDLIVGDFDSHGKPETDIETIVLPREKDDTDTVYAAKEALRRGFDEFLLAGVIGERFDHTFGNVSLLLKMDTLGKKAKILDDYGEMEIVSRKKAKIGGEFAYFSVLNIDGTAKGITIRGAKYPLDSAEIPSEYQYGISNEVLPGETAEVEVAEGRVLVVKVAGV